MKYGLIWTAENAVRDGNTILDAMTFKTGVINWPRVFGGRNYRAQRLDPNDLDVVHIQLTGDMVDAVQDMRRRITGDTKLVVNPDYALEYWYQYGAIPETIVECFRMADFVFGQSERTAEFLSCVLDRPVPYVPHPLDTYWLKNKAVAYEDRSTEDVAVSAHRDGSQHTPYYMTRDYDFVTHLIGWHGAEGFQRDVVHQYYTHVWPQIPNVEVIENIFRNAFCIIDHYAHSVQGRSTMEAAALGVPCFGWECVDAQARCFPSITSKTGDVADQIEMFRDLIKNPEQIRSIGKVAQRQAEFFSFENTKQKFMEMIEDGRDININAAAD
jgi:hypothetical protein